MERGVHVVKQLASYRIILRDDDVVLLSAASLTPGNARGQSAGPTSRAPQVGLQITAWVTSSRARNPPRLHTRLSIASILGGSSLNSPSLSGHPAMTTARPCVWYRMRIALQPLAPSIVHYCGMKSNRFQRRKRVWGPRMSTSATRSVLKKQRFGTSDNP